MEQYTDIKSEFQQDMQGLKQHVEQHSNFRGDVWQRAVKHYSRQLYRRNMIWLILLVLIMGASTVVLSLEAWPWWLLTSIDLFIGGIVLENLIATTGLRKADTQSRKGLLSLRENIHKNISYLKRKRLIIQIIGCILILVMGIFLFFHHRDFFILMLISCPIAYLFGRKASKQMTKHYEDLVEEIDELLKEE